MTRCINSRVSVSSPQSFASKSNMQDIGLSKGYFSVTNNFSNTMNGVSRKHKSWNWKQMMRKKIGSPNMVKLQKTFYPIIMGDRDDMVPPKLYTNTIESDEDNKIFENVQVNNDLDQSGASFMNCFTNMQSSNSNVPLFSFLQEESANPK